jgi:hypothetical protein
VAAAASLLGLVDEDVLTFDEREALDGRRVPAGILF